MRSGPSFSELQTSRNPGSNYYDDNSCRALIVDFVTPTLGFLDRHLPNLQKSSGDYLRYLKEANVTSEESLHLKDAITELPDTKEGARSLVQALLYSRTIESKKRRLEFYSLFDEIVQARPVKSKSIDYYLFSIHKKKIDNFKKKVLKLEHEKMAKKRPEYRVSDDLLEGLATRKSLQYEKLTLACKNQKQEAPKIGAGGYVKDVAKEADRVAIAMTIGGFGSAVGTYTLANWDLEKDERWFYDLAFTVITSTVISYVNAKFLLANPKLSPWSQRLPLTLVSGAVQDAGVSALYGYLFEESDTETLGKIKEFHASGKFDELNNELINIIEEKGLHEKHQQAFANLVQKVRVNDDVLEVNHLDPEERSRVTIEDLDDAAIRELFLEAMALYTYDDTKGPLNLGNPATDRYAFHRLIDLVHQPAFLMASIIMYKQLCMATNPKMGMLTAISTFMAINILMDALYFYGRRGVINQ